MDREVFNLFNKRLHKDQNLTLMMSGTERILHLKEIHILLLKELSQPHGSKQLTTTTKA